MGIDRAHRDMRTRKAVEKRIRDGCRHRDPVTGRALATVDAVLACLAERGSVDVVPPAHLRARYEAMARAEVVRRKPAP